MAEDQKKPEEQKSPKRVLLDRLMARFGEKPLREIDLVEIMRQCFELESEFARTELQDLHRAARHCLASTTNPAVAAAVLRSLYDVIAISDGKGNLEIRPIQSLDNEDSIQLQKQVRIAMTAAEDMVDAADMTHAQRAMRRLQERH